jgi:hypothetical protein|tara:strand:- start:1541 stop:1648 length:108 start_codon:yes stop_codon:yes gene_type:complete
MEKLNVDRIIKVLKDNKKIVIFVLIVFGAMLINYA